MIARHLHRSDFQSPAIVRASSIMRVRSPRVLSHRNGLVMDLLPLPPSFNYADVIRRCEQEIAAMFAIPFDYRSAPDYPWRYPQIAAVFAVPLVDPLTNQPSPWRSWP